MRGIQKVLAGDGNAAKAVRKYEQAELSGDADAIMDALNDVTEFDAWDVSLSSSLIIIVIVIKIIIRGILGIRDADQMAAAINDVMEFDAWDVSLSSLLIIIIMIIMIIMIMIIVTRVIKITIRVKIELHSSRNSTSNKDDYAQ
jgi:hypothetical protein